ncbi:hypothetical protein D3C79_910660 [compost metagenome]
MLRARRPSSPLTSSTFTCTSCPSFKASCGVLICLWAICEMCTNASTPRKTSTNAPNDVRRFTLPSNTVPLAARSSIFDQGPGIVSLIDNEIRSFSGSTERTFTFTSCPSDKTSLTSLTCSCDTCEICTRPSIPPRSMNAPNDAIR